MKDTEMPHNLRRILVQFDPDPHASLFDAVVAIDSEIDHLLQYSNVEPIQVRDLVYGAIFTRAMEELKSTAIFVGGQDVVAGELLLEQIKKTFFGPMRVSVMLDANGANTTAAAAVVAAARHLKLNDCQAVVLAGTGSVGKRVARLLAGAGAHVRVASRTLERAQSACDEIRQRCSATPLGKLEGVETSDASQTQHAIAGAELVISAGAAGVALLPQHIWHATSTTKVMIDLNAVPPLGIEGTEVMDKGIERNGVICYGAIGVGGTKMKIHKEAIRRLFSRNDLSLDAEEIFAIGQELEA
jgi:hypothetical protein